MNTQFGGSLYDGYCDNHVTQCSDSLEACTASSQSGGNAASLYDGYCDNNVTQCSDSLEACTASQSGGAFMDIIKDNRKISIFSKEGTDLLKKYIKEYFKTVKK